MKSYVAIIIDDDAFIRKSLQDLLLLHYPELQVLAVCKDAFEGLQAIVKHRPDLVFLDIEMPGRSGFEMLNQIQPVHFEIIFITSFDHYAIQAIRYSALDYLLKPVDPEELKFAIGRFISRKNESRNAEPALRNLINNLQAKTSDEFRLAIATTEGTLFLPAKEIRRLEADGSYTVFHLAGNKKLVASRTLKDFSELLDQTRFLRVHKSHVVNRSFVKRMLNTHHLLMEDDTEVEVSRRKWEEVKHAMKL